MKKTGMSEEHRKKISEGLKKTNAKKRKQKNLELDICLAFIEFSYQFGDYDEDDYSAEKSVVIKEKRNTHRTSFFEIDQEYVEEINNGYIDDIHSDVSVGDTVIRISDSYVRELDFFNELSNKFGGKIIMYGDYDGEIGIEIVGPDMKVIDALASFARL